MNAYQEYQTSGNHWPPVVRPMLHEESGSASEVEFRPIPGGRRPLQGGTVFDDLERHMVRYAAECKVVFQEIQRQFMMPGDCSVTAFLSDNSAISPMLLEAIPHLKTCFGADTILSLRVSIDGPGSPTLYAVVRWPGKVCDVRSALQRFDDEWWLKRAGQAAGLLTFTYELI
jgi:hypothetical protein